MPIGGWACQQTSQQFRSLVANTVLISEQRRLLMLALGWINSQPHCNRGWGHYCSYLRGIWHLKYTNRNGGYLMLLIEGVGFSMSSKTVPSPLTFFHFLFVSLLSFSSCLCSVRGAELSISIPPLRWRLCTLLFSWHFSTRHFAFLPFNLRNRFLDSMEKMFEWIKKCNILTTLPIRTQACMMLICF